jgi:hypothetical protein
MDTIERATPHEENMNIDLMFDEFILQDDDLSPSKTLVPNNAETF